MDEEDAGLHLQTLKVAGASVAGPRVCQALWLLPLLQVQKLLFPDCKEIENIREYDVFKVSEALIT